MSTHRHHPSRSTGIEEVRPDQRELILDYLDALMVAKTADVAGAEVVTPQGFVDAVVRKRVISAWDPVSWAAEERRMRLDMDHWRFRMADHRRRPARPPEPSVTARRDVSGVLERARTATPEQLAALDRLVVELDDHEQADIVAAWPLVKRPGAATLGHRGLQRAKGMAGLDMLRLSLPPFPRGVQRAAVGAFAGEQLPGPMYAVLLGPWRAVMDGDRTLLDEAMGPDARTMRRDLLALSREAFETAEEEQARRQEELDDLPF